MTALVFLLKNVQNRLGLVMILSLKSLTKLLYLQCVDGVTRTLKTVAYILELTGNL